jgi:hypothetical protein
MAEFVLGFKTLADMIPDVVGQPLEDEHHNPESGDGLQLTSKGLMVWRKADNWTAFTDGYRTWINGPNGLQTRLNTERFSWEREPVPSPVAERWYSPNCWPGRPYGPPVAIVIHTEGGSEAGTREWFRQDRAQVSAHFGVALDGHIDQFVDVRDRAWHAGILEPGNRWGEIRPDMINPNHVTVGIETEDGGNPDQVVTDAQYLGVHGACRLALNAYPDIRYLTGHCIISPVTRPGCPGHRWTDGRIQQLAGDLGLKLVI